MTDSESAPPPNRTASVNQFLILTYLAALANCSGFLANTQRDGLVTACFLMGVYLTYSILYLAPAVVIVKLTDRLAPKSAAWSDRLVFAVAVAATTLTQILIMVDKTIFGLFGMHYNGFIWNVVTTKGGLESMGGGGDTTAAFAGVMCLYLFIQVGLMFLTCRVRAMRSIGPMILTRRVKIALAVLFAAGAAGERITYGMSSLMQYSPVLASAGAFPFYQPTTFYHLAADFGFSVKRTDHLKINDSPLNLTYPLAPIRAHAPDQAYNIVWLVAESLRADMLDPEIMPATWRFAEQAHRFTNHYSGGNGTRMGLFSMFYGLYGNYWFPFLREGRGPVLMDLIQERDYQLDLYTSAKFSYPEFDRTIFARVPGDRLHEYNNGLGWERDRWNVGRLVDFVGNRDRSKPFMTFMFFESPHARYYFPPESVIRTPYLEDFNYATMNLERDIQLIKNRYINACHHLDSQLGRVTGYLEQEGLLDSTIVLITGDHGEEFLEKGRWGHNSEFTEEQVRVPFVLWVPGKGKAVVANITSHLDIAPTLMRLMGVENPVEDFSQGIDLFSGAQRDFTIICDWSRVCYRDEQYKGIFPISMGGVLQEQVTDAQDGKIADPQAFYDDRADRLLGVVRDLRRFSQ